VYIGVAFAWKWGFLPHGCFLATPQMQLVEEVLAGSTLEGDFSCHSL